MSILLLVLLFLKPDISSALSKIVRTPNNELFITGRGCGIETPIKYLNYFPSTLNEFECSLIQTIQKNQTKQTNQTKSYSSKLGKDIQFLQQYIAFPLFRM